MLQLGVGIRKLEFVGSVQTQQFSNYTLFLYKDWLQSQSYVNLSMEPDEICN